MEPVFAYGSCEEAVEPPYKAPGCPPLLGDLLLLTRFRQVRYVGDTSRDSAANGMLYLTLHGSYGPQHVFLIFKAGWRFRIGLS